MGRPDRDRPPRLGHQPRGRAPRWHDRSSRPRVSQPAAARRSSGWVVIREGQHQRWGGELRRRRIFERLAELTGATIVQDGWYPVLLRRAVRGRLGRLPGPLLYRLPQRGPKPKFAASEKLRDRLLDAAIAVTDPTVVAVYDDPVAQAQALGVAQDPGWIAELAARQRRNIAAFRWLVAPTRSFAELAGLPLDRLIVGGNGTDTSRITVGPWPSRPAVGIVSGAAPGRGLELLVDAVAAARTEVPDLVLRMWLVSTSEASEAYLREFRARLAGRTWVEIETAPYDRLGPLLATASVLAIPHPPNEYMDVALPVKLFDSLAAGRPLVVTPRTETASIVQRLGVGAVAAGDRAEDLAAAIVGLLAGATRLEALGARARAAAEHEFDWRIVGDRIASAVLDREGG
ncbi:MAG: glycosyltransferase [Chloroflexota bacterium]|nr:MAG: glycosyltransferase [Chloroflexota bacterium]